MGPDKQVPNIRKPVTVYGRCGGNYIYGRLAFANIRSAKVKVSKSELLRFFENRKWQWAWMGLPRSASPARVMLGCAHASGVLLQHVSHIAITLAQQSPVLFNVTATDLNVN